MTSLVVHNLQKHRKLRHLLPEHPALVTTEQLEEIHKR